MLKSENVLAARHQRRPLGKRISC